MYLISNITQLNTIFFSIELIKVIFFRYNRIKVHIISIGSFYMWGKLEKRTEMHDSIDLSMTLI